MSQAVSGRSAGQKLKIGFLWHQHQPYYKDLLTGEYVLPWVRLHGIKDYLDMVEILGPHPAIKQTFNMVPSLLEQLDEYARGVAVDPHLALSRKNAAELSREDKTRMIELFFQAHHDNMIRPYKKYDWLFRHRKNALAEWQEQDWRDLQVLSNLAWFDPMFKRGVRLGKLSAQGERYTEEEKLEVLDEQRKIIGRIVPTLKAYMEKGQIEISVTPYFHPIMPLLCDTSSALVAMPGAPMPKKRFRHPEDVDRQVGDAVALYAALFGRKPAGMWPSEGSVSEEIVPILAKHGIRWIATDEEILAESLGVPNRSSDSNSLMTSGQLYRGYEYSKDGARMALFFRDHALSDNIGFVYSGWVPERAADDFIGKLWAIYRNIQEKRVESPLVPVILDGENAWEYYLNDGHDFLEALYARIEAANWLETVTFSEYLDEKPNLGQLKRIFPGSWISHNFSVWIGHSEDNLAWDMLSRTRDELVAYQESQPGFDSEKLKLAWKEIYIAEGSDWCWWFGPHHVGPNNDDFDRLFRSHLSNVYWLTGRTPPRELLLPIRSSFIDAHFLRPVDFIKPVIDGRNTHFYEWQQAGHFDCAKAGSTMHRAERLLSGIWFGFDQANLYFRLDPAVTLEKPRLRALEFEFEFIDTAKMIVLLSGEREKARLNDEECPEIAFAIKDIIELSIPLVRFPKTPEDVILARINIKEDGKVLESWPPAEALKIELPNPHEIPWSV